MIKKYDIKTSEAKFDYSYELLWGKSFPDSMQLELEQKRNEYVAIKSSYGIDANERIDRLYSDCVLLSVKRLQEVQREMSYAKKYRGLRVIDGGRGAVDFKVMAAGGAK